MRWVRFATAAAVLTAVAGAAEVEKMPGYAGTPACAACHRKQADSWVHSTMYKALEPVETCKILIQNPDLEHKQGQYTTRIRREGSKTTYTVSDGNETWTANVLWAFGQGAAGQTYVLEHKGAHYESRLSYYIRLKGLDLTMGVPPQPPKTMEQALGRRMFRKDSSECFNCHSMARFEQQVMPAQVVSGVQCENCHGPSEAHVEGFKAGKVVKQKKLSTLNAEEVSDLCGGCHRTWAWIAMNGPRGVANVRFQPYRLALSKCFDATDRRIACVACHNPHEALNHSASAYDSKCLACHTQGAKAGAKVCPTGKQQCVDCHMATYEAPGSHWPFRDHNFRVVRAGEKYPD